MPSTTTCIVILFECTLNSIHIDDLRGSHVGTIHLAGKPQRCVSVRCSAICTTVLPVWSLKGGDECESTFPPLNQLTTLAASCVCVQPDYSCPEMSQTLASGSEHTLSLTRDPDNTERHTLLSHIAPVCFSVVFASLLGSDLPTTAGTPPQQVLASASLISICIFILFLRWSPSVAETPYLHFYLVHHN